MIPTQTTAFLSPARIPRTFKPMTDIDLKPTQEMAANAARGLELREKHGRGGTEVGVARARDLKNRANLSPETVRRMDSFFARHAVDKEGEGWGKDSAGWIAFLLWGGEAGKDWAARKAKELDRAEGKVENSRAERPSHRVTAGDGSITIHDLEVFCAYDPRIDGDSDEELATFDNERVRGIVEGTLKHMAKGSLPRLVVMHERDGQEPKSSIGRFTKLRYEERDGVGYIVGDCEVERSVFDKLLATNAFPRRSAEIWPEQNHLSEVALLGRETPRRPLPDTHFGRTGSPVRFSRSLRFDMGTVGGGLSPFVPSTKDTHQMDDLHKEVASLKAAMEEMKDAMKRAFAADEAKDGDKKEEMAAEDMLSQQFEAAPTDEKDTKMSYGEDGVHIDIASHEGAPDSIDLDEEEADELLLASRRGKPDVFALRRENAKMSRELKAIKAELKKAEFTREIDTLEAEGYRIPAAQRPRLMAELMASANPQDTIDCWRELFARDPMGIRIDMSRAAAPAGDLDGSEIASLVREFAGKPEEFTKAINSRLKKR